MSDHEGNETVSVAKGVAFSPKRALAGLVRVLATAMALMVIYVCLTGRGWQLKAFGLPPAILGLWAQIRQIRHDQGRVISKSEVVVASSVLIILGLIWATWTDPKLDAEPTYWQWPIHWYGIALMVVGWCAALAFFPRTAPKN